MISDDPNRKKRRRMEEVIIGSWNKGSVVVLSTSLPASGLTIDAVAAQLLLIEFLWIENGKFIVH